MSVSSSTQSLLRSNAAGQPVLLLLAAKFVRLILYNWLVISSLL